MRISASYSKKVQIKQYEPVEISCFVEREFEGSTSLKDAELGYDEQFNFCKEQVEKRIDLELRLIDSRKENQHKQKVDVAIEIGQEDPIGE